MQKTLTLDLGWEATRLCRIETGRTPPTLADCRAIVAALNARGVACSLDDVFPPDAAQQDNAAA
ncbi:transcriptional regulator [Pseudomonas sp. NPDC086581]|uniref:transcriptional regulator n=1 Tax=Pseudomonas sp. NPDC086581 TaxID=3364432 RepID=UPI0037FFFD94